MTWNSTGKEAYTEWGFTPNLSVKTVQNFFTVMIDMIITKHLTSLVMQRLQSFTNVLFPHISLISDALFMRYTWIGTGLLPKANLWTLLFLLNNYILSYIRT
jgi:hypothetical protein